MDLRTKTSDLSLEFPAEGNFLVVLFSSYRQTLRVLLARSLTVVSKCRATSATLLTFAPVYLLFRPVVNSLSSSTSATMPTSTLKSTETVCSPACFAPATASTMLANAESAPNLEVTECVDSADGCRVLSSCGVEPLGDSLDLEGDRERERERRFGVSSFAAARISTCAGLLMIPPSPSGDAGGESSTSIVGWKPSIGVRSPARLGDRSMLLKMSAKSGSDSEKLIGGRSGA
jgi:hypothetical protein